MANGIDRLEKLFSKRRPSSRPASPPSSYSDSNSDSNSLQEVTQIAKFPPPAFISPTSTRMKARDERKLKDTLGWGMTPHEIARRTMRFSSLDESHTTYDDSTPKSSESHVLGQSIPRVGQRRYGPAPAPKSRRYKSQDEGIRFSNSSRLAKDRPPRLKLNFEDFAWSDMGPFFAVPGIDTPPHSNEDEEKNQIFKTPNFGISRVRLAEPNVDPTPEASPQLTPLRDSGLLTPQLSSMVDLRPLLKRDSVEYSPRHVSSIRESSSVSPCAQPTKTELTQLDAELKEPDIGDFLVLSDDDVAESNPPSKTGEDAEDDHARADFAPTLLTTLSPNLTCRNPSPPSPPPAVQAPTVPARPTTAGRGLLPSTFPGRAHKYGTPSMQIKAATEAAFKATQIAERYGFDLLYVANIWPRHMALKENESPLYPDSPPPTPTQSRPSSSYPGSCKSTGTGITTWRSGMEYRFLAAYGLHTSKAPFRLFSETHSKLLNAEGWLQFKEVNEMDEFASGLGCSFYPCHVPVAQRPSSADGTRINMEPESNFFRAMPKSTGRLSKSSSRERKNRGIVFMAYRRPRPNHVVRDLYPDDFDNLYSEVETLVDFVLDSHTEQRRHEQFAALPLDRSGTMINASAWVSNPLSAQNFL